MFCWTVRPECRNSRLGDSVNEMWWSVGSCVSPALLEVSSEELFPRLISSSVIPGVPVPERGHVWRQEKHRLDPQCTGAWVKSDPQSSPAPTVQLLVHPAQWPPWPAALPLARPHPRSVLQRGTAAAVSRPSKQKLPLLLQIPSSCLSWIREWRRFLGVTNATRSRSWAREKRSEVARETGNPTRGVTKVTGGMETHTVRPAVDKRDIGCWVLLDRVYKVDLNR